MAADDRMERTLAAGLHAWLDHASGPSPRWDGSAVQLGTQADSVAGDRPTRSIVTTLLLAAVIVMLALAAAWVVGGRLDQRPSIVPPDNGFAVDPTDASPTASPAPTPSPSTPRSGPSPSPDRSEAASAPTCETRWTHAGTASPFGLVDGIRTVEFDASDGRVIVVFGHAIDSVESIAVARANPPFVTAAGRRVEVDGVAFYSLTLRGLTRPTTEVPANRTPGATVGPQPPTVGAPIAEMRRIREPRFASPVDGPQGHDTETWIIGLDHPACLRVATMHLTGYGSVDPGDNTVIVTFDPAPSPTPSG